MAYQTPAWLRERVNDPYGTVAKHPFWRTQPFEQIGTYKIFEKDGTWHAYETRWNAWSHHDSRDAAVEFAERVGPLDIWA